MATPAPHIELTNDRGIRFSLPPDLNCISTYVMLEQKRWFEKEIDFIYRFASPGMTAIDIGANIGFYTLPLAMQLGPLGKVTAYEPGNVNRQHLNRSLRLNRCRNVMVSAAALSDYSGPGLLQVASSGELNQLVSGPAPSEDVESVAVTTLDRELTGSRWTRLDFLKIDAEGQEAAIIRGGLQLLDKYSPLIMFELKHQAIVNLELVALFKSLDFDCYRLIGDGSMLVPVGSLDQLDGFVLNLFAARSDRAHQLAESGLLAQSGASAALSADEKTTAIEKYCALPFAQALDIGFADIENCAYAESLIAYAAYRFLPTLSPDRKLALLQFSYDSLIGRSQGPCTTGVLSTLSRVASDLGARSGAVAALNRMLTGGPLDLVEPFFPSSPRHEEIADRSAAEWFTDSIIESSELWSSWSTIYKHDNMSRLEWLALRKDASDEIVRRLLLTRARSGTLTGEQPTVCTETGSFEIPCDPDWLGLVRSLADVA